MAYFQGIFFLLFLITVHCTGNNTIFNENCQGNIECPADYVCFQSHCIPVQCQTAADCETGYVCTQNVCVLNCGAGEKRCSADGTGFQVCVNEGNGTVFWGATEPCSVDSPMICTGNGTCECDHQCEAGTQTCSGGGNVATCAPDALTCRVWQETEICDNALLKYCIQPNAGKAACECTNDCDGAACADDSALQTCLELSSGCFQLQAGAACPYGAMGRCDFSDSSCKGRLFQVNSESTPSSEANSLNLGVAKLDSGFGVAYGAYPNPEGGGGVLYHPLEVMTQIYARIYDATGNSQTVKVIEYTDGTGQISDPKVFNLKDQTFGIAWGYGPDSYSKKISEINYARIQYDGTPAGSPVPIQNWDQTQTVAFNAKSFADGSNFILAWIESNSPVYPPTKSLYLKGLKPNGDILKDPVLAAQGTHIGTQSILSSLSSGGFVISWQIQSIEIIPSWPGFHLACYNSDFSQKGNTFEKNADTDYGYAPNSLTPLPEGNFLLIFSKTKPGEMQQTIEWYYQIMKDSCQSKISAKKFLSVTQDALASKREGNGFFNAFSLDPAHILVTWVNAQRMSSSTYLEPTLKSMLVTYEDDTTEKGSIESVAELFLQDYPKALTGLSLDDQRTLFIFSPQGQIIFTAPDLNPEMDTPVRQLPWGVYGHFILNPAPEEE